MKVIFAALLLTASFAFALLGCSENPPSIVGPTSQANVSSALSKILPNHEGTIALQGRSIFEVYAKNEHTFILDPKDTWLDCTAGLVFIDKQNFVLTTTEWADVIGGHAYRIISFAGKMTPSGQLKFTWPEEWLEVNNWDELILTPHGDVLGQMREHTGYDFSGPGVNKNTVDYVGYFDGNRLFADFHLNAFQERPGSMPPYDVVVEGPILVDFGIDLNVSP